MGKTNWKRVFLGGVVAGILLLVLGTATTSILLKQWTPVMESLGHPLSGVFSVGDVIFGIVFSLILGLMAVWLYSAIRPRYGVGPKTAVIAGLIVWIFHSLFVSRYSLSVFDLFPFSVVVIDSLAFLVMYVIATLAGAWVYKEQE